MSLATASLSKAANRPSVAGAGRAVRYRHRTQDGGLCAGALLLDFKGYAGHFGSSLGNRDFAGIHLFGLYHAGGSDQFGA